MRRNLFARVALGFVSVAVFTCSTAFAADTVRIKLSVTGADSSPIAMGAKRWSELAKEKSNGRIVIQVYPNEQLSSGNQSKGLENLRMGIIQASFHSTIIYSNLDSRFSVPTLPWIFSGTDDVDKVLAGKGGKMLKDLAAKKDLVCVGFMENGFRQITNSARAIHTPADMVHMKIRVPSTKLYMDLFTALGADPTAMNIGEVFTSLQQKTIDGQENPISVIFSRKFYEVQKFLTIANYSYDPYICSFNSKFWNKLSTADQQILKDTFAEASKYQINLTRSTEQKQIEGIKASGCAVNVLTKDEIKAFQKAVAPVYDKYGPIYGKDVIDSFRAQ